MLLEYLTANYKNNEPIFTSDINLPVTDIQLQQMFDVLCTNGILCRYDTDIYYIKGTPKLRGGISISASEVARYKYISRNNQIYGYYTGYTFANQLGLTSQVPCAIEIVSNRVDIPCHEVLIKKQRILLRKPYVEITNENYCVLQLLDLLKNLEQYIDDDITIATRRIRDYIKEFKIQKTEIEKYIDAFPASTYTYICQII